MIITLVIASVLGIFAFSRSWKYALFISPMHTLSQSNNTIALTFDDGPSAERTPALLHLLQRYHVKATFFMLGENIEKHPDIARAVFQHGHLIGNHSYNHPRFIFTSPAFIRDQIVRTDRLIQATGQADVHYFRPPYSSKLIMLPWVLRSMQKVLVTGTYDPPAEYTSPLNPTKIANEVITHSQAGSIIYLHDGKSSDSATFIQSVELIIQGLYKKGFTFVRIDGVQ